MYRIWIAKRTNQVAEAPKHEGRFDNAIERTFLLPSPTTEVATDESLGNRRMEFFGKLFGRRNPAHDDSSEVTCRVCEQTVCDSGVTQMPPR